MSKGKTVVKESSTQEFPEWQKRGFEYLLNQGMEINETPFTPYTGDTVAPFTADELEAQGQFRNINSTIKGYDPVSRMYGETQNKIDLGNPYQLNPNTINTNFDRSNVREANTGSILDRNVSAYSNPYTDNVINKGLTDINKYRQMSLQSDQDAALGSNAFGGSRSALLESETNKNFNDQASDFITGARESAYNDAMSNIRGDMDYSSQDTQFNSGVDSDLLARRNDMAYNLGLRDDENMRYNTGVRNEFTNSQAALDESKRNFDYGAYNDLLDTQFMSADDLNKSGNLQRGLNQADLDAAYDEFMRKQQQPFTNLAASTSAISGVPTLINTTGTRTSQQKLGLGDALGYFANLGGSYATGRSR